MLLASDDERVDVDVGFTPSHAKGKTKLKGHEQIDVHELVQRDCRCQRKICFQQFGGYEKSVNAKRSELASLDPTDRATCLYLLCLKVFFWGGTKIQQAKKHFVAKSPTKE